jgi:hypothetical protein
MIRPEVARVVALAPLPREDDCSDPFIMEMDAALRALPMPVTDEEASALLDVLATPDDYYGGMWAVVHAVESAPNLPPEIWTREGPWFDSLRVAARNAGLTPPPE